MPKSYGLANPSFKPLPHLITEPVSLRRKHSVRGHNSTATYIVLTSYSSQP